MRKTLFYLFVVISSLSFGSVEAKQKNLFRLENDTILHVCSNLSEMDCWTFYESDESNNPSDYFTTYPYWRIKNIVIDEGVDSVYFRLYLISAKRLSIPSSLKYLYFSREVPPGLEEVRMSTKNSYLRWENGTLYNRDKTQLYFMLPSAVDSVLYIPETVEQVWNIPSRYYPKDTLYLKDLPYRHWEGYLERYPKGIHYSKIVFPKHCKRYPEGLSIYYSDSLIILSDSALAHSMMENLWGDIGWKRNFNEEDKFRCPNYTFHCPGYDVVHCPSYDVRKRDTSWMRESYRLTCVTEDGDTLVGVDTIPSGSRILSVRIEGIADENVRFRRFNDTYSFYVTTYDTLYRLPLKVFVKPEEQKPGPKWSDFGEVRDSVFTIREGIDSLPNFSRSDMSFPFRKIIIPKSMHYIGTDITCDSAFIYSDSLDRTDFVDAGYYYVENEQLYLAFRRRYGPAVYSPNADIRKRDMSLQQNTNKPVWKDMNGNVLKDLTYRPMRSGNTFLRLEIEGIDSRDLCVFVYDCGSKRYFPRINIDGRFSPLLREGKTAELAYAVWTYDTMLFLQQKDTIRPVNRDGTPWTRWSGWKESVLYYVPEGVTRHSLLDSKDSILMWRSGDTIPRRYANRLAFGFILENGEYEPSGYIKCDMLYLNKRNYFGEGILIRDSSESGIWEIPKQYKEFWMRDITEFFPDCIPRRYPPMHFYVGR
ncbi:MAG: hypothetical protein VZQ98_04275 [Bacteroidales bacterium]|nr:hypothetical protein [Bacteroidales bacterium]